MAEDTTPQTTTAPEQAAQAKTPIPEKTPIVCKNCGLNDTEGSPLCPRCSLSRDLADERAAAKESEAEKSEAEAATETADATKTSDREGQPKNEQDERENKTAPVPVPAPPSNTPISEDAAEAATEHEGNEGAGGHNAEA